MHNINRLLKILTGIFFASILLACSNANEVPSPPEFPPNRDLHVQINQYGVPQGYFNVFFLADDSKGDAPQYWDSLSATVNGQLVAHQSDTEFRRTFHTTIDGTVFSTGDSITVTITDARFGSKTFNLTMPDEVTTVNYSPDLSTWAQRISDNDTNNDAIQVTVNPTIYLNYHSVVLMANAPDPNQPEITVNMLVRSTRNNETVAFPNQENEPVWPRVKNGIIAGSGGQFTVNSYVETEDTLGDTPVHLSFKSSSIHLQNFTVQ